MALLAACVRRGLKVLSATGAGARADPTRIRIADLRESTNDPLSRAVMFPYTHSFPSCHVSFQLAKIVTLFSILSSYMMVDGYYQDS